MATLKTYATTLMLVVMTATSISTISQTAQARIKGPRLAGSMAYCGGIQDALDQVVREMVNLLRARQYGSAEYNALRQKGRDLMAVWNESCVHSYGNPFYAPASANLFSDKLTAPGGTISEPGGNPAPKVKILKPGGTFSR